MGVSGGFNLIMVSAMNESGGNVLHRMFDGHPEMYVYPFESQLGNSRVVDHLSSLFPFKYRWPEFTFTLNSDELYEMFYDEELKTRLRRPEASKFKDADVRLDENERKRIFKELLNATQLTGAGIIESYFRATFMSWSNRNGSGREKFYVGYSPIIAVDTDKIMADFPGAHVVHIVRNPFSSFAETKRRPFPLTLYRFIWQWNIVQHMALVSAGRYPDHFHLIRYEDLISDTEEQMAILAEKIGFSFHHSLLHPSWNGVRLDSVYPWGTIRVPTTEANRARFYELSDSERAEIVSLSTLMLEALGYDSYCRDGL